MAFWKDAVDKLLDFQGLKVLKGNGSISRESMEQIAFAAYDEFDSKRKVQAAIKADLEDIKELENLEKKISKKKKR